MDAWSWITGANQCFTIEIMEDHEKTGKNLTIKGDKIIWLKK